MKTGRDVPPAGAAEREVLRAAGDPVLERMLADERVETRGLDATILRRLARYLRPHRLLAGGAVALAIAEALSMTIPPLVIGLTIDRLTGAERRTGTLDGIASALARAVPEGLTAPAGLPPEVFGYTVLFLVTWALRWIVAVATTYIVQALGQAILHDLRVDVFRHVTAMDADWLGRNPVGRLVNRTTFDLQAVGELFSDAFAQGLRDLFFILVLGAVMLWLDAPLAALLLAAFPPLVLIGAAYRRMARDPLRTNAAVQSRMNAWIAENVAGMRENQLLCVEDRRRAEFEALTRAYQASVTRVVRSWAWLRPAMLMTTAAATAGVLLVGARRVDAGIVTVGVLLTFIQYTTRLWVPVRGLTEKFNMIQAALTSGERVMDILAARPAIADGPATVPGLAVREGRIAFEDVSFRYPGSGEAALSGISFTVPRGAMVALVGDTGAGKTSVVRLLSRFYEPDAGRVLVDGEDVRRYPLAALRAAIALVPQEVTLFRGSVRENVTLGRDVPDQAVREALRAARALDFVERLPGGLDAPVEEAGRTLSGGERQLLSFARALVLDPPILVLDEATASVDTATERLVQDAVLDLTRGRTSVVIAHRLSTIRAADEILVMRGGRIVERGRHEALLARGGEYARLWRAHAHHP